MKSVNCIRIPFVFEWDECQQERYDEYYIFIAIRFEKLCPYKRDEKERIILNSVF